MLEPKEGLLTFRAEGNNIKGSRYYSRVIHWPANSSTCSTVSSGVTLGRGYDLGQRSHYTATRDLLFSGVGKAEAEQVASGARLTGCRADKFVRENKHQIKEITELQQVNLFKKTYKEYIFLSQSFYDRIKKTRS